MTIGGTQAFFATILSMGTCFLLASCDQYQMSGENKDFLFADTIELPAPRGEPMREDQLKCLFFTPDGEERSGAVCDWYDKLDGADVNARASLLEFLCDVVERSQGLSQFVALDTLYTYFDSEENWPFMSDRVAKTMAAFIKLNNLGPLTIVFRENFEKNAFTDPVIQPRCLTDRKSVV